MGWQGKPIGSVNVDREVHVNISGSAIVHAGQATFDPDETPCRWWCRAHATVDVPCGNVDERHDRCGWVWLVPAPAPPGH